MAVKDSEELKANERYPLGDYSFRIERTSVPGSTNDKIEAICTDKDGKNARKSIQISSSTKLDGWYVEANETEATVYAVVQVQEGGSEYSSDLDTSPISQPIPSAGTAVIENNEKIITFTGATFTCASRSSGAIVFLASETPTTAHYVDQIKGGGKYEADVQLGGNSYTHNGKTVYYSYVSIGIRNATISPDAGPGSSSPDAAVAWTIIYGTPTGGEYDDPKTVMIGRFAIDIQDAGGVGPGSDWIDPGDYDPDWEEGDPTHTLYVTVTGALSGRHNDPIVDSSYSYIPADKDTVKDYGCGGDGGHGGGGGAGASTVVIHKFATNQANFKEITAIARRHGYGSGGGKGGKGGDGCILVYY